MERREALRRTALLLGGAVSASTFSILFDSCSQPAKKADNEILFSPEQETLITEIADVIIPDTSTPGAKAAGVGLFIPMMIRECYPPDVQNLFVEGLDDVQKRADSKFGKSFVALATPQRTQVLKEIADETFPLIDKDDEKRKSEAGINRIVNNTNTGQKEKFYFFQLIRELTMLGYFTSEIGATQALAYLPFPGKYESCTDLKPGQKAWAL